MTKGKEPSYIKTTVLSQLSTYLIASIAIACHST